MTDDENLYANDPKRLEALETLGNLFSPTARPAGEVLEIARRVEALPGIDTFFASVPYNIGKVGEPAKSGLNERMRGAIRTIIADLEAMSADDLVVVDIDAKRLPKREAGKRQMGG